MLGSNSSVFSNKFIILSFKFVKCHMGLYIWETILSETLTKVNANRRNCFCCLVLSYCDRRIWIAVDENGWQSTKLNDNVSKLIDQRQNWNEHSHIPECPGRNWKRIFVLNEEVTKMGGKTYSQVFGFAWFTRRKFWLRSCHYCNSCSMNC